MFDFSNKYAVVTGGRQGIGEAIVRRFIAEQISGVAILDIQDSRALAEELDPSGERLLPIVCDIADRDAVAAAFRQIYQQFGRVDFLINNAGIARDGLFHTMEDEQWETVLDVNLKGAYHCTRQVINPMREQASGRIVFLSSIAIYGVANESNYSASKGALYTLTKTLAREQMRHNITVNCVIPGPIDTALFQYVSGFNPNPNVQRVGKPEDVASLVCYLCTDEAYFINGARIDINGGLQ